MLDRYKDIVKTGGENVSSLRVESVLMQHPAVAKAVVIGLPHPHWGEAVTGVVIREPGLGAVEAELIAYCSSGWPVTRRRRACCSWTNYPRRSAARCSSTSCAPRYAGHFAGDGSDAMNVAPEPGPARQHRRLPDPQRRARARGSARSWTASGRGPTPSSTRWVNRLAHGLTGLGYARGDALALASGNSAEFLAVYYACAKLGVVCVPINLGWRADEVAYVLGHSRCAWHGGGIATGRPS